MTDWVQMMPGVKRRILVDGDQLMLVQVTLDAGAVVPTHQHVHEQITYVLEGHLDFKVGGELHVVRTGDSVHMASNVPHQVTAHVNSRVLDVFSPPREDFRTTGPVLSTANAITATTTSSVEAQAVNNPPTTTARHWYGLDQPKPQPLKVVASVDAQVIRDDYKEGLWLGKKGDVSGNPMYFREAIVFFERVIQYAGEDPAYVEAYNAMAACYRRIGDRVLYEAYKAEYEKRRAEIAT
ncbi:MAG TPA: cupin domain-containing protein [Aggregatilineales bacterium]|nr:cupin domain-containing protein [Aggregatilineales bacterium]